MQILNQYELWSGQLVSIQKSAVLFSPNVDRGTREAISRIMGMQEVTSHGKYLGLPSTIGASKKEIFSSILVRLKRKIYDWKSKLLSKAGKEVFIKSVLQSIPTYVMQCFRLPIQVCNAINSILASFWWGDTDEKRTIHWVAWTTLCKHKSKGGLGFREAHSFNQALLCKQAWRLINRPNCPLALMYKARYYPNGSFWTAALGSKPSYTWRSLLSVRDLLTQGTKWTVGNGHGIHVWNHNWLPHTNSGKPITPRNEAFSDLSVKDLIDEEIGVWKLDLIRNLFYAIDSGEILKMPLPNLHRADTVIWTYGANGVFRSIVLTNIAKI